MRVAIIGTAGRGVAASRMTSTVLYDRMVAAVRDVLKEEGALGDAVCLQSGGAAWADHVAVSLFLGQEVGSLTLFLPCAWETLQSQDGLPSGRFVDTAAASWRTNPGRTANAYHQQFSTILRKSSLDQIALAQTVGARLDTSSKGFHARNTKIADCDLLIALSWAAGSEPTDGGTRDTWSKCNRSVKKIHISLPNILGGATAPGAEKRAHEDERVPKKRSRIHVQYSCK